MIQATTTVSQKYEEQLATLTQKMASMEQLLIEQRQKGQRLESELSSAQDRIGGAERRARTLEEENIKIKGELQSWNDYYNQEETSPEIPISNPISTPLPAPDGTSLFDFSTPMSMPVTVFGMPIMVSI